MKFKFSRGVDQLPNLDDAEELKQFAGATHSERRGPLQVTTDVRDGAAHRLTQFATKRAAQFARERPDLADFRAVGAEHPALFRLATADVVATAELAEVS